MLLVSFMTVSAVTKINFKSEIPVFVARTNPFLSSSSTAQMCEGTDALEGPSLSLSLPPRSDCAASLDDAKFVMMDDVNGADNELDHLAAFLPLRLRHQSQSCFVGVKRF